MKQKKIKERIPYMGLILVIVLFSVFTKGSILTVKNLKIITEQSILTMVASAGVVFVLAIGELDLSQGSLLGIGSIVACKLAPVSIPLALFSTVFTCGLIGSLNGVLNACLKIPSFIATICVMYIFRGLTAYTLSSGALSVPASIYALDSFSLKIPAVILILAASFLLIGYTRFGKQVKAIGDGEVAARYSGIFIEWVKIKVFAVAGMAAGFAAFFNIIRVGTATTKTGQFFETDVLLSLVLGGMSISGGTKTRPLSIVIGAFLIAFLNNGLVKLGVSDAYQQLTKGVVFLLFILISVTKEKNVVVK